MIRLFKKVKKSQMKADLGTDPVNVRHWLDISSVGLISVGGFLPNDNGCPQMSLTELSSDTEALKNGDSDQRSTFAN